MTREKLTTSAIENHLQALAGWSLSGNGEFLEKTYRFDSFAAAFGFMAQCAIYAERIDHHPDWTNVYRTVAVRLSTHSTGGISALDIDLAAFMEKAAARH